MRVARNEDPGNYSESDPTQYANYGGTSGEAYSEYGSAVQPTTPTGYGQTPPPPRPPWHQKPAVLVGLGVLTAAILALLVYAVVKFVGSDSTTPAVTSTTSSTPATTSSAPSSTQTAAPAPAPTTETVTVSPTAPSTTTITPTTTAAPVTTTTTTTTTPAPTTTTTISTSVTTVTETTTKRPWPTIPTFPSPTLYQPPGQ